MTSRIVQFGKLVGAWILPAYLALGLLFGGSSREGVLANGALQVLGALILLWCALDPRLPGPDQRARWLQAAAGIFAIYILFQLVPLPPGIWTMLPGREFVVDGIGAFGRQNLPAMPLSLAPQETLDGLLRFLPPLAVFVLTYKTASRRADGRMLIVIVAAAVASSLIGWVQIFDGRESPLYFWGVTNRGSPVGLMANANHQAMLLNAALPFCMAHLSQLKVHSDMGDADAGQFLLASFAALLLVIGVLIAGSLAGYILFGLIAALSFLMYRGRKVRLRDGLVGLGLALGVAGLGWWLASSPILPALGVTSLSDSELGRPNTWRLTLSAAADYFPFGSGLGTFERLIPMYEDPATVTGTFLNHAHNDYLEVWLELGLVGAFLILLALVTFARLSLIAWKSESGESGRMKKAASIAAGAIFLHSIVDYPLRTETIAMLAAFAIGRLATHSARRLRKPASGTPPASHVVI